jgi:ketosteroid isomerase-like protein
MAQGSPEGLLRLNELLGRRDFDGVLEYMATDVELRPGILAPDQDRVYRGRAGVKEFLVGATEAWESVTVDREETVDAGDERYIAFDRWLFRGRDGIEIERLLPTVYAFRSGLIVRIDGFTDEAEARRFTRS